MAMCCAPWWSKFQGAKIRLQSVRGSGLPINRLHRQTDYRTKFSDDERIAECIQKYPRTPTIPYRRADTTNMRTQKIPTLGSRVS